MRDCGFLTPVTENFLHAYGVGKVAFELALKFNVDPETAFIAGSLHDLGGAIPDSDRVEVAESLGIELFEEEREVPMLVHAKQGDYFAQVLFGIESHDVLDSIRYHTTCIDNASNLVKIIFIADKIHWDRNGEPPYLKGLLNALDRSLDEGCRYFLEWLWNSDLYVVHPFLVRSYGYYLKGQDFPALTRETRNVYVSEDIKRKYFLNEIVCEFQKAFGMGKKASELFPKGSERFNKAFIAAALANSANTIFKNQRQYVANKFGLKTGHETNESLLPKLSHYFAKNRFGIDDPELLQAILYHQQELHCESAICHSVQIAYQKLYKKETK